MTIGNASANAHRITLLLNNYEFMHFGDHLFFEPLVHALDNAGYDVRVWPVTQMSLYFQLCGYKTADDDFLRSSDVIISRVEFLNAMLTPQLNNAMRLLFDTSYPYIHKPLCCDLIEKTFQLINAELKPEYLRFEPSYPDTFNALPDWPADQQVVLFNPYVDSGSFRPLQAMRRKLVTLAEQFTRRGYSIVLTGSANDAAQDQASYDFVTHDMRGKTTVSNMFWICAQSNVVHNISFDTFQFHLCMLKRVKSFVTFRGRLLKRNADYILNSVLPPFVYDGPINSLVEYL